MIDEMMLRSAISANVRRLREERGWSQEELAQRSGMSYVQINRLENRHHTPGADRLYNLADALGVPADSLRQVAENVAG